MKIPLLVVLLAHLAASTQIPEMCFLYALVPGIGATNNQQFLISGNQLRTNTNLNYEQQNSYSIRVQTSDGNGGTYSKAIIIHIVNVNDAPTLISLSNATIKENASTNSLVGLIGPEQMRELCFFS